ARFAPQRVTVVCGPGNNGGDGYVCARVLADCGWPVAVVSPLPAERLTGDAAWARATWRGAIEPAVEHGGTGLLVDALFGAGLTRDVDGPALTAIRQMASSGRPVVAVDVSVWGRCGYGSRARRCEPGHVDGDVLPREARPRPVARPRPRR
ncbi:MAG: hypothetical protein HC869_02080, partial [Rhodospirillales bacterium]|nr:hypothetical protein [Rhodospirillales bacterium]